MKKSYRNALLVGCLAAVLASGAPAGEERIVTVGGAITEIVFALGLGDAVVGSDTSSVYPEAAQKQAKVGYARALSAEGVLSLRPTRLIASQDAGPPVALQQIRDSGVEVTLVEEEASIAGAKAKIDEVAGVLERPRQARTLVGNLDDDLRDAQPLTDLDPAPRVLFVYARGAGTLLVAGRDTPAHSMIDLAGGVNAGAGHEGFKPMTAEATVVADPDVVLMLARGVESLGGSKAVLALPGVAQTRAGRGQRVIVMDDLYLLGFGPRTGKAVADLARELRKVDVASQ